MQKLPDNPANLGINRFASVTVYTLLVAAPYMLFIGFLMVAWPLNWLVGVTSAFDWWVACRWFLRLGLPIGTAMAWWRQWQLGNAVDDRRKPYPLWLYAWLGFTVYELVALLLTVGIVIVDDYAGVSSLFVPIGLLIMALAFVPFAILAIWLGQRDAQLAAYTIFPYAALTAPLLYMGLLGEFSGDVEWEMITASLLPLFVAALIHAVLFTWYQGRSHRWWLLYGGAGVTQFVFAAALAWQNGTPWLLFLAVPLLFVAIAILISPVVLSGIWNAMLQLVDRLGGAVLRRHLQQRFQEWQGGHSLSRELHHQKLNPLGGNIMSESKQEEPSMEDTTGGARRPSADTGTDHTFSGPPSRPPSLPPSLSPYQPVGPGLERLYKLAVVLLATMIVVSIVLFVGRAAVYKIHEYERGLHLRGGRFLAIQEPGWHVQIPLVDTVIIVKINERLGYVEQIPAMTSDNVTMIVSLQYTYRVIEPQQYALQVDDPERIVFEFVQGKLRDVVNTKAMADVMNDRALMNQQVMEALKEKEEQYGVRFVTVQMQSASPPDEVLTAIKDRMVAVQRQEQAQAEAAQQRTIAEAELYSAQKRADARAYEITRTAEAEAERIRLTTEAQQLSIRSVIDELEGKGALADKFLDYLIAQELRENSKWIINGEGTPLVNVQE